MQWSLSPSLSSCIFNHLWHLNPHTLYYQTLLLYVVIKGTLSRDSLITCKTRFHKNLDHPPFLLGGIFFSKCFQCLNLFSNLNTCLFIFFFTCRVASSIWITRIVIINLAQGIKHIPFFICYYKYWSGTQHIQETIYLTADLLCRMGPSTLKCSFLEFVI